MFPSNEKPTLDIPDMDEDALDFEDDEVRMMKTKNLSCMRYVSEWQLHATTVLSYAYSLSSVSEDTEM